MGYILKATLVGLFFGTFGTTLGGFIGLKLKGESNKFLSFILSFASGLMVSIVCFELIPEAMELAKLSTVMIGVILGVFVMIVCDIFVDSKFTKKERTINNKNLKNGMLKMGIVVSIGLALHNFPEGLAIGSGFGASLKLGYALAIAIAIHDIPEGISMAVPMKAGGMKYSKIIVYVILSGVTTGLGAFFGAIIGQISQSIIALCLSFAAGAMLFISSGELLPQSNKLYNGKSIALGNILGFLLGILATTI